MEPHYVRIFYIFLGIPKYKNRIKKNFLNISHTEIDFRKMRTMNKL